MTQVTYHVEREEHEDKKKKKKKSVVFKASS
jgi:hypothetical protein